MGLDVGRTVMMLGDTSTCSHSVHRMACTTLCEPDKHRILHSQLRLAESWAVVCIRTCSPSPRLHRPYFQSIPGKHHPGWMRDRWQVLPLVVASPTASVHSHSLPLVHGAQGCQAPHQPAPLLHHCKEVREEMLRSWRPGSWEWQS